MVAGGGGDAPEDGYEALAYAIRLKWNTAENVKKRHIIVLFTDEDAHPLGFGKTSQYYPKEMPNDYQELTEW